jgi:hypothetical protein
LLNITAKTSCTTNHNGHHVFHKLELKPEEFCPLVDGLINLLPCHYVDPDAIADTVNALLVDANGAILNGYHDVAILKIIELAVYVFSISPFTPETLPHNSKQIITIWLSGKTLTQENIPNIDEALQFIEDGLIYRLPWGVEAIRVRAVANADRFPDGMTLD